jgi:hypothetical protein
MNNQQIESERMNFLFISNISTYATYTCGFTLRTSVILLTSLMLGLQIWILYKVILIALNDGNNMIPVIVYHSLIVLIWLLMLAGPITQSFELCHTNTIVLQVSTYVEFLVKVLLFVFLAVDFLPLTVTCLYLFLFLIYLAGWYFTVYIYFSYAKSLGFGLISSDINHANYQSSYLIPRNAQQAEAASNTNLTVIQIPTITPTNPHIAFVKDIQESGVNQSTQSTDIIVPGGGNEKN